MPKKAKFAAGTTLIVGAVLTLACAGFDEGKAYYQTVSELKVMGSSAEGVRLRVGGQVVPGSISRREGVVEFQIAEDEEILNVRYVGRDPLPDTLVDRTQALAEGHFPKGTFEAPMVQAKRARRTRLTTARAGKPVREASLCRRS